MSRKKLDLVFSIGLVLLIAWAVIEVREWPARSRIFPLTLGIPVLVLALIQSAVAARALLRPAAAALSAAVTSPESAYQVVNGPEAGSETEADDVDSRVARQRGLAMVGWTLAFFFGIWCLGFKIGSALLTFAFLKLGAGEGPKTSLALAIGTYLFFLLLFDIALQVPFPNGLIADALGLQSPDWYLINAVLDLFRGH